MAKAPSGLSLKRNGNSFSCGWKKGDKYTAQQFQYRIGGGKWTALSVAKGTTSKAFSININNYYPVKSKTIGSVSFRVRGKKGKWSGWSNKSFAITAPRPASVDVSRSDDYTNVATFSWSVVVNSNDAPMFTNCEWQTIRADDASVTNGAQLKWNSSVAGWQTGTASPTSYSKEITEETDVLANGSHTRWFRVRSRGVRGASEWRYSKWVYAIPYAAVIESATATVSDAGGFICTVKWTADATAANPIAAVHVQYSIVTPDIGMTYPDSDSWTDAMTIRDTSGADAATFSISGSPTADQCLFVRVNTEHDGKLTYGIPKVAAVGRLADPENLSVDTYPDTHRATITATNTSNVPDSFLAVIYRVASEPDKSFVVGIIPHGETSVNVQCPDWGSESPAFGVYAVAGSYEEQTREDGVSNYAVDAAMTSIETLWRGGQVPLAPTNVVVTPTETTGTVRVTWDWNWREAEEAILSWSDHADAWESTDEPTEYRISNLHASQWNIAELETGKKWYVRVRLVKLSGDGETPSPWSEIASIDLSSAPSIPSMTLSSSIITADGSLTAYWSYITTDGTKQAYAEICEATIGSDGIEYGDIIAHTETAQHITITAEDIGWSAGETHYLAVRVVSGAGRRSDGWSVPVPVTIAEPLEAEIMQTSLVDTTQTTTDEEDQPVERTVRTLTELPLTITVTGAGEGGVTTLVIERSAEYHVDRPDETEYTGHDGETIVNYRQTGEAQITIDTDDLIGNLDDDAQYRIVATVQDGLGQSATAAQDFEVHWTHQAITPEATVEIQNNVAIITPIKPDGWEAGDTCDIYRLSADAPELIVQGAEFGTQYVDPYPAIGEFGGHRIVYKTANGDYITAENEMAWIDLGEDDGDILDIEESIIDYGDEQIMLYYDVDVSNNWEKDFNETRYLGGSVAGDWNAGVGRSSSVSVTTLSITDKDKIKALRRLAEYPNICHIRTLDGSSYSCDIQVSENRDASKYNEVANFSLSVTRIDPQELDGITYELWSE